MKKFLLILLIISPNAFANWANLVCVAPSDNFTISVELNEKLQLVRLNEGANVRASFTPIAITFFVKLSEANYFHSINRSTGVMMIRNESSGQLLTPYQCSVATKKF